MGNKMRWADVPLQTKIAWANRHRMGESLDAEAETMGWSSPSLKRELNRFLSYYKQFITETYKSVDIPPAPGKTYNDYPVINADDAIIISDTEIPDHSALMLKLALLVGMRRGIKRLIHAGDVVATDQSALNSWITTWIEPKEYTYEQVISLTNDIFCELDEWFDDTDIVEGNHDSIIARRTRGNVHLGMMLNRSRVRYNRYSYLYMRTSNRGLIRVTHPENFSSDPVTLGQQLYDVEQGPDFNPLDPFNTLEKCHIVLAHCHRTQSGMSKDGAYEIHSIDANRDIKQTKYVSKGVNKHRKWDYSFMVVQNGFFHPMKLIGTNWREELGDLYDISPLAQVK